jgi:hypothetical protein
MSKKYAKKAFGFDNRLLVVGALQIFKLIKY